MGSAAVWSLRGTPCGDDPTRRRRGVEILARDRRGHHVGKLVRRTGKARETHTGIGSGHSVIVARRAVVTQRQQSDALHPRLHQSGQAPQHLRLIAAFIQIANGRSSSSTTVATT